MSAYVYRIFDADDTLIYVGSSTSPTTRVGQHGRTAAWGDEIHYWTSEPHPSRSDAYAAEREVIRDEKPKHNVRRAAASGAEQARIIDEAITAGVTPAMLDAELDRRRHRSEGALRQDERKRLGHRIKVLRLGAGMTQAELAERLSVTQPAVSQWETGAIMPLRAAQFEIADALHTTRSRLFREIAEAECAATGGAA